MRALGIVAIVLAVLYGAWFGAVLVSHVWHRRVLPAFMLWQLRRRLRKGARK